MTVVTARPLMRVRSTPAQRQGRAYIKLRGVLAASFGRPGQFDLVAAQWYQQCLDLRVAFKDALGQAVEHRHRLPEHEQVLLAPVARYCPGDLVSAALHPTVAMA